MTCRVLTDQLIHSLTSLWKFHTLKTLRDHRVVEVLQAPARTKVLAGAFAFRGAMADQGSTSRETATDDHSGAHRLRDIVVEEVSLVDRAANKRRFLLVKRSNQMADNGRPKGRSISGGASAGEGSR